MRCAVARASKGYHILKPIIYIYTCQVFHSSFKSLRPNQLKFIISTFHISLKSLSQFHITKYHLPSLQPNVTTTTTLTLTYRCIVSSRGIQASNLHYMIWHCVPLHNEGTISLSGNLQRGNPCSVSITEWERLDSSMSNNRRGGWALQCQTTVGHFSQ